MLLISTFYVTSGLENYVDMKPLLLECCIDHSIKGTIILSEEGINATICGEESSVKLVLEFITSDERLKNLSPQYSYCHFSPFQKMKVLLRNEIVYLGVEGVHAKESGSYIEVDDWDEFISRPDVKIIDTRNAYETCLGSFEGAIIPSTENFRDFPDWFKSWLEKEQIQKDQKIAMFCTGGVRCEKSTAMLKKMGFLNVYHLRGGIIAYLGKKQGSAGKWFGDCFVFDDRVAINYRLMPNASVKCTICKTPLKIEDLKDTTRGRVICLGCMPCSTKKKPHSEKIIGSNIYD